MCVCTHTHIYNQVLDLDKKAQKQTKIYGNSVYHVDEILNHWSKNLFFNKSYMILILCHKKDKTYMD